RGVFVKDAAEPGRGKIAAVQPAIEVAANLAVGENAGKRAFKRESLPLEFAGLPLDELAVFAFLFLMEVDSAQVGISAVNEQTIDGDGIEARHHGNVAKAEDLADGGIDAVFCGRLQVHH